jgi:tetratricopeptide (TPR) repeat protein
LNNLGNVYQDQGQYTYALAAYKEAMEIAIEKYESNHISIADTLNNLSIMYKKQGQYSDSVEALKQAENIYTNILGEKHLSVAKTLKNLGAVYSELCKYQLALDVYEKVKQINISIHDGKQHASIADVLIDLGKIYCDQGKFIDALQSYSNAKKIYIDIYGEQHAKIAYVMNDLGNVYKEQGRYTDALGEYEQAKQIFQAVHGEGHFTVAASLNNIGNICALQHNYEQAIKKYEEAKQINIKVYGKLHSTVAEILNNLGIIYKDQCLYANALTIFLEAQKIFESIYGKNHFLVAVTLNNLGIVYCNQGRYLESINAYVKSKEIKIAVFGKEHYSVAKVLNNLGNVYKNQFEFNLAFNSFIEAIRIKKNIYGNQHISVADTLNNLGLVLIEMNKYESARKCFNESYSIHKLPNDLTELNLIEKYIKLSYIREGNFFMLNNNIEKAEYCYRIVKYFLDPKTTAIHYLLSYSNHHYTNSLPSAIEHYQLLIKQAPQDYVVYHNLACLTHIKALIEKDKGKEENYIVYLREADCYFQKALELNYNAAIYAEYANFMLRNYQHFKHNKIIDYLLKATQSDRKGNNLTYGIAERASVDSELQCLIDQHKEISFRPYLFAHYLLIQVYLLNNQVDEARQIFNLFLEEIKKIKTVHEKERIQFLYQIEMSKEVDTKNAEITQQIIDEQQVSQEEEKQLIYELVTISQKAINNFKLSLPLKEDAKIAPEFEGAINLSLENSTEVSQKVNSTTTSAITHQQESRTISLFRGSPITVAGDAHNILIKRILAAVNTNPESILFFLADIQEKAYTKALRRGCNESGERALRLISILLEFKEVLSININEQGGEKQFAAIHYAGSKGNKLLYELLVKHGADINLKDKDNITAVEYMRKHEEKKQSILHT